MQPSIHSKHFILHRLAEGVYAAIATEAGAGFSNAGLIDLGDQTLIFDAFETPQAAEDLLKAAIQLTSRKLTSVIVSHMHPDHWGGLQVFTSNAILATPATRQAMLPIVDEILQDKKDPSGMEEALREAEIQLAAETDPVKGQNIRNAIARQRYSLQALPTLEPILPNQTFEGKVVFYGQQRSAELIATGKGHTDSDCILYLPQDRVAFIGDIGFFQSQPFMPYGSPPEWIALLEDMATWDVEIFVPGHGPLGGKVDLNLEARYIRALEKKVQQVVQAGGSLDDALCQILPTPFDAWQIVGHRFEANVRASYERQSGKYRSSNR